MSDSGTFTAQTSFSDRPDPYRELQRATGSDHVALLYQSRQEQLDGALAFVKLGLEHDERCLYIADESDPAEICDGLRALGVDVATARNQDQLRIVPASETVLDGEFDPEAMIELLDAAVEESLANGFAGLRVTGETTWIHRTDTPFESVADCESRCEQLIPDEALVVLCQYDLRELDDAAIAALLRTHRQLIYQHRVCENPYHETLDGNVTLSDPVIDAKSMLETIYRLSTANDEIRQREQRVAVLNRVLRHNLRNEMNVIQSHAELMRGETEPARAGSVDAILSATDRLMEISEDAKRVEQSVSGGVNRVPIDLRRVVERAATRVREHYPATAITVPTDGGQWVEASDELEVALVELFQTVAAMAEEGAKIVVEFDDKNVPHARCCLRVRCQNAELPEAEIEALARGEETQLSHGSGLGLWLVNWIVELSDGKLFFDEADTGTKEIVLSFISA